MSPEPKHQMRRSCVAPQSEMERTLVSLWQQLFNLDCVGIDDNFFDLGGDSIRATQLVTRLNEQFGISLSVTLVFDSPTVRQIAEAIARPSHNGSKRDAAITADRSKRERHGSAPADSSACSVRAKGVARSQQTSSLRRPLSFSVYFFSADGSTDSHDKYRMLQECSRYADRNGFSAVWIPERHFSSFGGLYPNPSVLGAAVAMITDRIQIRAGSVVVPLQDPLRIAEEWSVVDNLSNGRVAIACASGWHPNDFVLAPANYSDRRRIMTEQIETIRRLWKGDSIRRPNGLGQDVEVRVLPRPIQPTIPVWLAAHSDATFEKAGEIGANIVTNIWKTDLDGLARQIELYRDSWTRHQEKGTRGSVALMIHTFLSDSQSDVISKLNSAYGEYLFEFLDLRDKEAAGLRQEFQLSQHERDNLVARATQQLIESHGLVGTLDRCSCILDSIRDCDIDEVACLVDFGIDFDSVMQSLDRLAELKSHLD